MTNPLDYTGKVALITGAGAGMGLAAAKMFAEAGAAVVLSDYKEDQVAHAAEQLLSLGHKAISIVCDVSDEAQVEALVGRAVSEFGQLDAAFNNAGAMAKVAPIVEGQRDEWERVIGINLRGVWTCMKYELQQMKRQDWGGAIVNNASVGAMTGHRRGRSVHRVQAWRYRPDSHGCSGVCARQDPCQRRQPWCCRNADRSRCC